MTFARSWENIVVSSAGKAGIGIVTMDGAHIHDVHYHADVYDPFEDDGGMSGEDEGDLHDVDDDEADFDDEGEDGYVDDLYDDDW